VHSPTLIFILVFAGFREWMKYLKRGETGSQDGGENSAFFCSLVYVPDEVFIEESVTGSETFDL
jgi:hypothetical protein